MDTFTLKFKIQDDGEIVLDILWVEGNETRTIPKGCWPTSSSQIQVIARALFTKFDTQLLIKESKRKIRIAKRNRYAKSLGAKEIQVSSKTSDKVYTLTVVTSGDKRKIHCNCPDYVWRQRARGSYCKHISEWLGTRMPCISKQFVDKKPGNDFFNPHQPIRSLHLKINRTLRTYDCDDFLLERFEKQCIQNVEFLESARRRKELLQRYAAGQVST